MSEENETGEADSSTPPPPAPAPPPKAQTNYLAAIARHVQGPYGFPAGVIVGVALGSGMDLSKIASTVEAVKEIQVEEAPADPPAPVASATEVEIEDVHTDPGE